MATQDTSKIKESILIFLKNEGPTLPIKISKNVKVDSLFISAFLSELLREQKIKITNMKVGTSPIYYLEGTESKLEKFSEYLKPKEKEAFLLLKDKKFLEDETQHPAIRVALRSIKDFAKPFKTEDKIIWRYFLTPINEYRKQINPLKEKKDEKNEKIIEKNQKKELPKTFLSDIQKTFETKEEEKEDEPKKMNKHKEEEKPKEQEIKKEINTEHTEKPKELERILPKEEKPIFINPLAKKEQEKKTKEKPKSEFVQKTIEFINKNGWEIVEELDYKAKEYNCLTLINSDLGPIIFKTQAKQKKTISEIDMSKLLGEAQAIPLPALFLVPAEPKKKAQDFLEKYTSVMKFKKIE